MNCYYCGKEMGNTDPKPLETGHPTRVQCAECAIDYKYIHARGQRPLLNLLTRVIRSDEQNQAAQVVVKLTAKAIGWMDQGLGHGHYGWRPLTQEEFFDLHEALGKLGALEKETDKKAPMFPEFGADGKDI